MLTAPPPYRLVRELGHRVVPAYAALRPAEHGATELVVLHRVRVDDDTGAEAVAMQVEALAELSHGAIVPVFEATRVGQDVWVQSEYVDGVTLADWLADGSRPSLAMVLRALVDVLEGLAALHSLGDGDCARVHADLSPASVVVGLDGHARLLPGLGTHAAGCAPSHYQAPELIVEDEPTRAADLYAVGVMLWEVLAQRSWQAEDSPPAGLSGGSTVPQEPPPIPAEAPWAAPLALVCARATSAEAGARFASATAFADAIVEACGPHLASNDEVAGFLLATHGERVSARRASFEGTGPKGAPMRPTPLPPVRSGPRREILELGAAENVAVLSSAPPPPPDGDVIVVVPPTPAFPSDLGVGLPGRASDPGLLRPSDPGSSRASDPGSSRASDPGSSRASDPGSARVSDPGPSRVSDPGPARTDSEPQAGARRARRRDPGVRPPPGESFAGVHAVPRSIRPTEDDASLPRVIVDEKTDPSVLVFPPPPHPAPAPAVAPAMISAHPQEGGGGEAPRARSRAWLWALPAVVALVVVGIAGWQLTRRSTVPAAGAAPERSAAAAALDSVSEAQTAALRPNPAPSAAPRPSGSGARPVQAAGTKKP